MLCSLGSTAFAQSAGENAILALSKNKFRWMVEKKYDSLESALDDRMIFIHSNGWQETKQEFIDDIKSAKLLYNAIEVKEATARVYAETAVIIGRGNFSVKLDGKNLAFDLKYTEVYVRKRGRWLLVSRHANRMQ